MIDTWKEVNNIADRMTDWERSLLLYYMLGYFSCEINESPDILEKAKSIVEKQ